MLFSLRNFISSLAVLLCRRSCLLWRNVMYDTRMPGRRMTTGSIAGRPADIAVMWYWSCVASQVTALACRHGNVRIQLRSANFVQLLSESQRHWPEAVVFSARGVFFPRTTNCYSWLFLHLQVVFKMLIKVYCCFATSQCNRKTNPIRICAVNGSSYGFVLFHAVSNCLYSFHENLHQFCW